MPGILPVKRDESEEDSQNLISTDTISMMVNPAYAMFKKAMIELEANPSRDSVSDVHLSLLMDGAQKDPKIHRMLPILCRYLAMPELYNDLCVVLSDISHLNPAVVRVLLEINLFDMLDFSKSISFSLVFAICNSNREAWSCFSKKYLSEEYQGNDKIRMLMEEHGQNL